MTKPYFYNYSLAYFKLICVGALSLLLSGCYLEVKEAHINDNYLLRLTKEQAAIKLWEISGGEGKLHQYYDTMRISNRKIYSIYEPSKTGRGRYRSFMIAQRPDRDYGILIEHVKGARRPLKLSFFDFKGTAKRKHRSCPLPSSYSNAGPVFKVARNLGLKIKFVERKNGTDSFAYDGILNNRTVWAFFDGVRNTKGALGYPCVEYSR